MIKGKQVDNYEQYFNMFLGMTREELLAYQVEMHSNAEKAKADVLGISVRAMRLMAQHYATKCPSAA